MTRSDAELGELVERFEKWAEELDPATTPAEDVSDVRAVAEAADAVRADEARLREAVAVARAHGRSWSHIGLALGVSRQAARQRYGTPTPVD